MKKFILSICLLFCLAAESQVNKGMPDIMDVVKNFFSIYSSINTGEKHLHFEKRKSGWFITEYSIQSGESIQPSFKFWDRAQQRFLSIPYQQRPFEDPANADSDVVLFKERFLDEFQLYYYRHNLFYGYNGWDWDVIQALDTSQPMTDSLYEALGMACSHYGLAYFNLMKETPFVNGDADRSPLSDSEIIGPERVKKFKLFSDQSIDAYLKLADINPSYQTFKCQSRYVASMQKIESYTILQFLNHEEDAADYLKGVIFPDSLLSNAANVLKEVAANSILLSDNYVQSYAIIYLQSQGIRKDIISIYRPLLIQRRALQYLDKKYQGSLLGIDSSVYMNPQYDYSFYEQDMDDRIAVSLDNFLNRLNKSSFLSTFAKDNKTPSYTTDSSFRFYSKNIFISVDIKKATKLYGKEKFQDHIIVPVEKDYLLMDDMIWLSIVNKNFLKKRIYYLFPYFSDLTNTGIKKRRLYWELTPM